MSQTLRERRRVNFEKLLKPWQLYLSLAMAVGGGIATSAFAVSHFDDRLSEAERKIAELRSHAGWKDGEDQKAQRNMLRIGTKLGVKDLELPEAYKP